MLKLRLVSQKTLSCKHTMLLRGIHSIFGSIKHSLRLTGVKRKNLALLATNCVSDRSKLLTYLSYQATVRLAILRAECAEKISARQSCTSVCNTVRLLYVNADRCMHLITSPTRATVNAELRAGFFRDAVRCDRDRHNLHYACYDYYGAYLLCNAYTTILSISTGAHQHGAASLPTRIHKYTVLRSPHTNKRSREQFEMRTHKKVYTLYDTFSEYYPYPCEERYSTFFCNVTYNAITEYNNQVKS
jgi:hypothetical protein